MTYGTRATRQSRLQVVSKDVFNPRKAVANKPKRVMSPFPFSPLPLLLPNVFSSRNALCYAVIAAINAPFARRAAADTQYFAGDGSALNASKYSVANGSASGPFTSSFISGNVIGFGIANGTGIGPTSAITIGGITATQNFTLSSPGSSLSATSVIPVKVSSGFVVDLGGSNAFISSSPTGGYILSGGGAFATAGNTFGGGVTLNGGSTLIARGVNSLGSTATNTLTINSGVIASSKTNDFSGKFAGGITVGGDFQLGVLIANSPVAILSDSYNQTFSNNIALGTATSRTITLGNRGTQTLGGVISGNSGLTFAAISGAEATVASNGAFAITGTTNNFTGAVSINGPEVSFAADGGFGNVANTININGGRLTGTTSFVINAGRGIQIGNATGTAINASAAATTLVYNGVIGDVSGQTGSFAKQGAGILSLGGASAYTGDTTINSGTLLLTTGNDRLPTNTTVNIGQAASANVGKFDLNGRNQTISGLNSIVGTNSSTTAKNTVTSAATAVLTLGGSGNYTYGAGTNPNSGIITGAIAINKTGSGAQTFSDANTYSGGTTVSAGVLQLGSSSTVSGGVVTSGPVGTSTVTLADGATVSSNAAAPAGNRTINNNLSLSGNVTLGDGTSTGILAFDNTGLTTKSAVLTANTTLNTLSGVNIASVISGAFGLTKANSGQLALSGANTYTGDTNLSGGILLLQNSNALRNSTLNTSIVAALNFGSLSTSETSPTFNLGALTGDGAIALRDNAGNSPFKPVNLVIGNNNNPSPAIFSGYISQEGSITKVGTGVEVFSGNSNQYTGNTTVAGGTLQLAPSSGNNNITTSRRITVQAAATLDVSPTAANGGFTLDGSQTLAGTGKVIGSVNVGGQATISPGDTDGTAGTLATGNLVFKSSGNYAIDINAASTTNDVISVTNGGLDLTQLSGDPNSSNGLMQFNLSVAGLPANATSNYVIVQVSTAGGNKISSSVSSDQIASLFVLSGAANYTVVEDTSVSGFDSLELAPADTNPAPELGSISLFGTAATALLLRRRRHRLELGNDSFAVTVTA